MLSARASSNGLLAVFNAVRARHKTWQRWQLSVLIFVISSVAITGCGRRSGAKVAVAVTPRADPAPVAPATRHPSNLQVTARKASAKAVLTDAPKIRLTCGTGRAKAVVEVVNLPAEDLDKLSQAKLGTDDWAALFSVHVDQDKEKVDGNSLSILGTYKIEEKMLRFEPRFPLRRGLHYRAVYDTAQFPELKGPRHLVKKFHLRKTQPEISTGVTQVYPSTDKLPENQLKFYIHFSAPMSRGEAYPHLHLLDAGGTAVAMPFLELDEELWDPGCQRFTLFFDPGRIKRGLKPREEVGPVLVEGKTYTLVVDKQWADANGNPLKETIRKTFTALPPVDQPIDPKAWRVQTPRAGSMEKLTVTFPRPLDHAMLEHALWVTTSDHKRIAGAIAVTKEETTWQYMPREPWQAGAYLLTAEKALEDLAGNSIAKPFEIDVLHPIQRKLEAETITLPFAIEKTKH